MVTLEAVFSKKNQRAALDYLSTKKNGAGIDKMPLTELNEYWEENSNRIIELINNGEYKPGLVVEYEIVNGKGKRRSVTKQNTIDRFIMRLLAQKLSAYYEKTFLEHNFAFREEKGIVKAVETARDFIEAGDNIVAQIDISHFFDEIDLGKLQAKISETITDRRVVGLINSYLTCSVLRDEVIVKRDRGIIQGFSISPVLSNLYLNELDQLMEQNNYHWVRFCDDIFLFSDSDKELEVEYQQIIDALREKMQLSVNLSKSGIFDVYEQPMLGYEFQKRGKRVLFKRHKYQRQDFFRNWHECNVEKVNREYHLLNNGIINKKDYALLFENEESKYHIPVEATEQINIYNEVLLTSNVMQTLAQENIRIALFDKYGGLLGYFTPGTYEDDARVMIAQALIYADSAKRLTMAKKMEIAAIHNLRANLKYYNKIKGGFDDEIVKLTEAITNMNESYSVDQLLLIEGRCRQLYYHSFNKIIENDDFTFVIRTKRPPKDAINALISFGNTLLYNKFQTIIWKTQLDIRVGVFHAANKRPCSLNLDFADMFKPIITDRIIFKIINRRQINADSFSVAEDGAVYLTNEGKKVFLEEFEEKLNTKIDVKGEIITYNKLMENEVWKYALYISKGQNYKPYKYY